MSEEQTNTEFNMDKFGADKETVREIVNNPDGVYNLLKSKRTATAEARDRREFIEGLSTIYGKTPDEMKMQQRVYNILKTNAAGYNELDDNERVLADELVTLGRLDASITGQTDATNSPKMKTDKNKVDKDMPNELSPEIQAKLDAYSELQQKNNIYEAEKLLQLHGANKDGIEDLAHFYKGIEIPKNTSSEDAEALMLEHINNFKSAHPWGFSATDTEVQNVPTSTHNARITPPAAGQTAFEAAKQKRDIDAGLAALRKG